jgi:hypothetical protein
MTHSNRATLKNLRFAFAEFMFRIGKVMFVAVLFILIFLLGEAMVHRRFLQGGRYHQNGSVGQ